MGHSITAIIGRRYVIETIAAVAGCPKPTELPLDLLIAPLGHSQIDGLTKLEPGHRFDGFNYLSAGLEDALVKAAGGGQFAYIETDYFGGTGAQAATVYSNGEVTLRKAIPISRNPHQSGDPINSALRLLGVKASRPRDEFDTVGLGTFRTPEALGIEEQYDE